MKPQRSDYPYSKQFFSILDDSLTQNLPYNLPISNSSLKFSDQQYVVSCLSCKEHNITNFSLNPTTYWGIQDSNQIALPYFPYFSNCKVRK